MAKPYSMDLRERVVEAVERDGLSCNQAAARFAVAVSTGIDWVNRYRETGSVAPGQMGGHRPKKLVGGYRDRLLRRCRERDFTLRGLVGELAARGLSVVSLPKTSSAPDWLCGRQLGPTVFVMKSTEDRPRGDETELPNRANERRILAQRLVPGEGLGDLPRNPFRCRMVGDTQRDQASPLVPQDDQDEQQSKVDRRNDKKVHGADTGHMMCKNVFHVWPDPGRRVAMYLATVD
jgi:transposase